MTALIDTPSLDTLLAQLGDTVPLPTSMAVFEEHNLLRAEGEVDDKSWSFWFFKGKATLRIGRLQIDSEGASTSSDVTFSTDRFARTDPRPTVIEMIAGLWGVIHHTRQ